MNTKQNTTQRYLGLITLIISLVVFSSFLGFTYRTNALFDTLLLEEARAFNTEIMLVRRWVREHGGVYVREKEKKSNPKRVIVDQDGEVLRQLNTAEVTAALSRLSHESGIIHFGSTSMSPLNPINKPDTFEQEGLKKLSTGIKEVFAFDTVEGVLEFRYMSPLVTRKGCLNCHVDGSFRLGEINSGLTIHIPAAEISREKRLNRTWMVISGGGVILLVILSIWMVARRFIRKLSEADQRLEKLAAEDVLTGLLNRRMGMELLAKEVARSERTGHPLSLAILDIDHFKAINDKMGHLIGDQGLQVLADLIRSQIRESDIAFRYGGEEFVLVLPDTEAPQATEVAERLRQTVENSKIKTSHPETLIFTISIGIEQLQKGMDVQFLLGNADEALYKAKNNGRNRCVLFNQ